MVLKREKSDGIRRRKVDFTVKRMSTQDACLNKSYSESPGV